MRFSAIRLSILFSCLLICIYCETSFALDIQIGTQTVTAGESISVEVTADGYDQQQIAAVAFTLIYSTDYLTLTGVDSEFFDTFENQWASLDPIPDPLPETSVEVDGQVYSQPLLFHTVPGSPTGATMIAAVRVTAGTPAVLFTLHLTVSPDAPDGEYPIVLSPTTLSNVDAGYDSQGEEIPVLYDAIEGETDPALAYPSYDPGLINGAIIVQATSDTDNDGIDDDWEITHFQNLTTANAGSDFDLDGLKDIDEFENDTNPKLKDSDGDGIDDATEVALGSNPNDGQEFACRLHAGYNLIAIPADVTGQPDLKDWLLALGIDDEIDTIMAYDSANGMFSSFDPDVSYDLSNSEGVVLQADSDAIITFTSLDCLSVDLVGGLNISGFTCAPLEYSAHDLLTTLGSQNVSSIQRYNPVSGVFETAAFSPDGQPLGVDFPIIPGEAYFIYMLDDVSGFSLQ